MREETLKRLTYLQAKAVFGWLPAVAAVAVLVAGMLAHVVSSRNDRQVGGIVERANWRVNYDTGHHYPFIEAKLDSGASVRVGTLAPMLPNVGDRITLRRRAVLLNAKAVYEWDGPETAAASTVVPTPVSLPSP